MVCSPPLPRSWSSLLSINSYKPQFNQPVNYSIHLQTTRNYIPIYIYGQVISRFTFVFPSFLVQQTHGGQPHFPCLYYLTHARTISYFNPPAFLHTVMTVYLIMHSNIIKKNKIVSQLAAPLTNRILSRQYSQITMCAMVTFKNVNSLHHLKIFHTSPHFW